MRDRQAGRQAGGQAGKRAGRQAGGQAGRRAGRQAAQTQRHGGEQDLRLKHLLRPSKVGDTEMTRDFCLCLLHNLNRCRS
eukprot:219984-Hanusia_phi.AAC.1